MSPVVEAVPADPAATLVLAEPSIDKIAEAEELAAEALRMANEAKRAAERLAEVKATLSRFSKKLESSEISVEKNATTKTEALKVVVVPPKKEVADATPFETDKADAIAAKVEKVVETPKKEVIEPPASPKKRVTLVTEPTVQRAVISSDVIIIEDSAEKDAIESLLDSIGLDKACGVDDEAVMKTLLTEQNMALKPTIVPVEKEEPVVERKPVPAKSIAAAPPTPVYSLPKESLVLEDDIDKDVIERFFDLTVGKACGVDDVTLGLALPYVPDAEKAPFVNPTRVTDIKLSKSMEEELVKAATKDEAEGKTPAPKSKYPPKSYQTSNTNADFSDPFGVDHDNFVTCGTLADVCEPELIPLEKPSYMATITDDDKMVPVVDAPTTELPSVVESDEEVEAEVEEKKEEVADDEKSLEPEGEKTSDEELYPVAEETAAATPVEEETKEVSTTPLPVEVVEEEEKKEDTEEDKEIMALNELQRRELERRMREQEELLRQIDGHVGCL